jgi:hypothetical protein
VADVEHNDWVIVVWDAGRNQDAAVLTELHGRIKQTEAWVALTDGCRALQAKILGDVHQE